MPLRTLRVPLPALVVLFAFPAFAQTSTGGTTASSTTSTALAESDLTITVQTKDASGSWIDLDTEETKTFFDRGRCTCGGTVRFVVEAASSSVETKISNLLDASGADGEARLYLAQSSGCTSDPTESSYGCVLLDQIDSLDSLTSGGSWTSTEVKIASLFSSDGTCELLKTTYVWLWIDTASDGSANLTGDSAPSLSLRLDGKGPSAPTDLAVVGGKEALILSWAEPSGSSSSTSDLAGYLVFCSNSDGTPVFATSPYNSQFVTPATLSAASLCPNQDALDSSTMTATLGNLDSTFLCSGLIATGQTSYRLKGLQNNVPYVVVLVGVDNDGNLGTPTGAMTGTPVLTVDFYNEYANEGGDAVGGYCSFAKGVVRPGGFLLLLGVLFGAHRRRRLGIVIFVLGILAARSALGQAIFHDDEAMLFEGTNQERIGTSPRTMALEFRVGPYSPDVDSGLSNGATPLRDTFGSSNRVLYQLEIAYDLWQGFGNVGLGAGLGYFRESAKAFVADSNGVSTGERSADNTSLRLLPISLLAIYRFDVLALQWHVPIVPYVKVGLNYTLWKVTDGNGDVARLASGDGGSGGTLGWQATAGLALQLDSLDPISMHLLDDETGLNHVYLFWDYSHIDASGLGLGRRLHVGDDTWSAGLLVEF
jgi:hypothetical protein